MSTILASHYTTAPDAVAFRAGFGQWTNVSQLHVGEAIAVAGQDGWVFFERIVDIERLPPEPVYDIEVEGTHNFVAGHWIEAAAPQLGARSWKLGASTSSPQPPAPSHVEYIPIDEMQRGARSSKLGAIAPPPPPPPPPPHSQGEARHQGAPPGVSLPMAEMQLTVLMGLLPCARAM
ncbi:hypothetical protein HYZ80_03490 [Candidatus Parcubacteria bacterium]|nr:hypothetical protein [Candidatus Parcubacteria bacterium]